MAEHLAAIVGVLAGGRGVRMGGVDKAALRAPGSEQTLLHRLARISGELGLRVVVVGGAPRAGFSVLPDDPPGVGPIGGLAALLAYAQGAPVLGLACDLAYVPSEFIARLARSRSSASVLAPRDPDSGKWQTLCARYDSARVLPIARAAISGGVRSLQRLFRELDVEELPLAPHEHAWLRDWDEPSDLEAGSKY